VTLSNDELFRPILQNELKHSFSESIRQWSGLMVFAIFDYLLHLKLKITL